MTEHALVSLCCGSKTKEYTICVNFEVLTAMKMSMPVFWFVMLCGLVYSPDNGYSIFSQSLVSTYKPTQCHNPEDKHQYYIIWLSSIHGEMEIGIYQDCFPCCPSFIPYYHKHISMNILFCTLMECFGFLCAKSGQYTMRKMQVGLLLKTCLLSYSNRFFWVGLEINHG
jgi:hypothetical protein